MKLQEGSYESCSGNFPSWRELEWLPQQIIYLRKVFLPNDADGIVLTRTPLAGQCLSCRLKFADRSYSNLAMNTATLMYFCAVSKISVWILPNHEDLLRTR